MRPAVIAMLALLVAALGAVVAHADTSDATRVDTGTPFGGWWDRWGIAHLSNCQPGEQPPNCGHHRVECEPSQSQVYATKPACNTAYGPGDWAVDYYGDNRPIIYINPAATGIVTAKVWAIYPTCSGSAGAAIAGSTVFVDLYVNGSWEGWESFGHLRDVTVSPGESLTPSRVLGYTKLWPKKIGCYEVDNTDGVHTHHEEWNRYLYACYWNYTSGTYMSYNNPFGRIGRTIYTGPKLPC